MSKYTNEQIKAMAQSALWHKENSPDAYAEFVMVMTLRSWLHPAKVDKMIKDLAEMKL
jgi:hypothetical protein